MDTAIRKLSHVQTILEFTYGIVPIVAGADKFANLLTNWSEYLNPSWAAILPFSADIFMMLVGAIEIIAGALVFVRPKIGAYLVCAWLVFIALGLITSGTFLDVAVRDIVMAIGAFSLAQLSSLKNTVNTSTHEGIHS